ncbi:ornithine decarboxylase 1-like [Rana temporaria]|uniref:ornithine decarboxylase 1-like n=1 Tax=Rana temporaria TaxID=8407 RepID=UPI001AACAC1B|nr:ornithine decarboxylase 1-like [Rana temporaria]
MEMCIVRKKKSKPDEKLYSSSIWGPTCDADDRIIERCDLPELQEGDWILFENMGAYTVVASSTFNGFQRPTLHYVMSRPHWQLMHTIQEHGTFPEVSELSDVHVSCVAKNRMELNSIACIV